MHTLNDQNRVQDFIEGAFSMGEDSPAGETRVSFGFVPHIAGTFPIEKLADVNIRFHGGPLDGLTLVGTQLWKGENKNSVRIIWTSGLVHEGRPLKLSAHIADEWKRFVAGK